MRYIFVDESRLSQSRYQLFGSLWLPREIQQDFREGFWNLWDNEFPSRKSQLKWTKVSRGKLESYQNFVDYWLKKPKIDFRCLILDTHAIDYQKYHQGDKELGFYKFLYFFLSRNIEKDCHYRKIEDVYQIFIHARRQKDNVEFGRLEDLKFCLNRRLRKSCPEKKSNLDVKVIFPSKNEWFNKPIRNIEAIDSYLSPEIQLVDVLTGAVGYTWEGFQTSPAKLSFINYIEKLLEMKLNKPTSYLTDKMNIWKFKLQEQTKSAPPPTPPKGLGVH